MVTPIDRAHLLRLLADDGVQLIDVLPEDEYAESHIPDAISIPLRQLTAERVAPLRRDKPVVVY